MTTKTYKSDMDVRISVNGKEIHFTCGYWFNGERQPSMLETSDEDVMKAVESNAMYGNRIHCIKVVKTEETLEEALVEEAAEEEPKEEAEAVVYEEPTSVKEAMAILMNKPYEMKASQCSTKDKVRQAEKKFNISFPNVK